MPETSVMRLLRLRYHISLRELAQSARVSHQHLSNIELGKYGRNENAGAVAQSAFAGLVAARQSGAQSLAQAYAANRSRLLEFIDEEDDYGL